MSTHTLTARWVFPVAGPPLSRGTVTVRGSRIAAVEPHGLHAPDEDLGNVALIPGLVNAHTHLDLSGARGAVPPTPANRFTDWLSAVIAYRRSRPPESVYVDIRAGLAEALRYGTTLLGDISVEGASWDALAAAPIRAVVFREMIGLGKRTSEAAVEAAGAWLAERQSTDTCRAGLSPHAPYSVRLGMFAAAGKLCLPAKSPLAVHLAESDAEVELLYHRRGPFVEFLKGLRLWDEAEFAGGFQQVMNACDFRQPRLFVHGNRLPPTVRLRRGSAVVYCPRTHAAFGHPPHPFRSFLSREAGVVVCLGTDSLASNPDLDPLAEARFVRARDPDVPGDVLLRMVTQFGAEALGWGDECGTLEAGKSADLVAVPLPPADADDPHELLLADFPAERRTMFRGLWR
jgi:aminodeoxyfutalosine deaminase